MIQLNFRSGPPVILSADEIVRILLPGDHFERRRAHELAVGDILQARGRIREITSFEASPQHDQLTRKSA